MSTYPLGQNVRLPATFERNDTGAAVDPASVTFKVRTPAGVLSTFVYGVDAQVVKDSTGNYRVDVTGSSAGVWQYEWSSSGTYATAGNGEFHIQSTGF